MRPETLRTWLGLFGDGQDRRKDYLSWLCGYFRTGNRLKDREKQALLEWLVSHGLQTETLEEYVTVQYSHDECADGLGCAHQQAVRHRDWALEKGLLFVIKKGTKGCATLYIVAPVSVTKSTNNVTSNEVTTDSGLGNNSTEIGSHQNSVTRANDAISRVIQNNPEQSADTCPHCGAHLDLTTNGLLYCSSCNTATKRNER